MKNENDVLCQLNSIIQDIELFGYMPTHLILVIKSSPEDIEVIHETQDILGKAKYYRDIYKDVKGTLCLKSNEDIQLGGIVVL